MPYTKSPIEIAGLKFSEQVILVTPVGNNGLIVELKVKSLAVIK